MGASRFPEGRLIVAAALRASRRENPPGDGRPVPIGVLGPEFPDPGEPFDGGCLNSGGRAPTVGVQMPARARARGGPSETLGAGRMDDEMREVIEEFLVESHE